MTSAMSEVEHSTHRYVMDMLRPHVPHTLDLSDDRQYEFLKSHLQRAGLSTDTHPDVFDTIETARQNHQADGAAPERLVNQPDYSAPGTWGATSIITSLGIDSANKVATASALTATPSYVTRNYQILTLWDMTNPSSPVQIASTTNDIPLGGTYDEIVVSGQIAGGIDAEVVFLNSIVPATDDENSNLKAGRPAFFVQASGTTQLTRDSANDPIQPLSVTNPVTTSGRPYVKVALNRTSQQQPDCDYIYQTGSSGPTPIVAIGGQGTAVWDPNSPIQVPLADSGPTPNFFAFLTLTKPGSGGIFISNQTSLVQYFSVSNGSTLTWDFSPYNFGQAAPWSAGDTVDYYLSVGVLIGNNTSYSTLTVSVQPCDPNDNSCFQVLPIIFVWGCLAAGTAVLLADGSSVNVEDVVPGMSVAAGRDGRRLQVAETFIGREQDPLIRLSTGSGRTVLVTAEHPLVTDGGMKLARDLRLGDSVMTVAGAEIIVATTNESHVGAVYNLALRTADASAPPIEDATHFANGFLVGDHRAQSVVASRFYAGRSQLDRHVRAWEQHFAELATSLAEKA